MMARINLHPAFGVYIPHLSCDMAGGEQGLGDYSFSGFKSPRGAEAGDSAAEQAAQSAAASTFEVGQSLVMLLALYVHRLTLSLICKGPSSWINIRSGCSAS